MQEDKLREKIAKKLCEMEGWLWDAIPRESNTLFCSTSKSHYYRDADEILAVISGHNRDGISKKEMNMRQVEQPLLYPKAGE